MVCRVCRFCDSVAGLFSVRLDYQRKPAAPVRLCHLMGWGFLALSIVIPGVFTMTVFRRHTGPYSDVRYDPTVHRAYVDVYLQSLKLKPNEMLKSVAAATLLTMDVEDSLRDSFSISEPDWKRATYRGTKVGMLQRFVVRQY